MRAGIVHAVSLFPLHLGRDPAGETKRVEPDEAAGVVLIAGFNFGFHRGVHVPDFFSRFLPALPTCSANCITFASE